jgi:hypothetical protein
VPQQLLPTTRRVLGLAVQAAVFWLVLAGLGLGAVSASTWASLHGVLAIALLVLRVAPGSAARWRARTSMAVAFYAAFLAAFFAGADFGLDALHGLQRRQSQMGSELFGLALWQLLCPGVFSLALGALVDCLCSDEPAIKPAD